MSNERTRASCKHLTYRHPTLMGCTLLEICIIAITYIVMNILLSIGLAIFFGQFFLFFIGLFLVSYFFIKKTAQIIGSMKEGKQPGYLILRTRLFLHQKIGFSTPYISRAGAWSTRRSVK